MSGWKPDDFGHVLSNGMSWSGYVDSPDIGEPREWFWSVYYEERCVALGFSESEHQALYEADSLIERLSFKRAS